MIINDKPRHYTGLSTDTKPNLGWRGNGCVFLESDTGREYAYSAKVGAWLPLAESVDAPCIGILKIEKTSSKGSIDTYTIKYTNGSSTTFDVTNGGSLAYTAGNGITIAEDNTIAADVKVVPYTGSITQLSDEIIQTLNIGDLLVRAYKNTSSKSQGGVYSVTYILKSSDSRVTNIALARCNELQVETISFSYIQEESRWDAEQDIKHLVNRDELNLSYILSEDTTELDEEQAGYLHDCLVCVVAQNSEPYNMSQFYSSYIDLGNNKVVFRSAVADGVVTDLIATFSPELNGGCSITYERHDLNVGSFEPLIIDFPVQALNETGESEGSVDPKLMQKLTEDIKKLYTCRLHIVFYDVAPEEAARALSPTPLLLSLQAINDTNEMQYIFAGICNDFAIQLVITGSMPRALTWRYQLHLLNLKFKPVGPAILNLTFNDLDCSSITLTDEEISTILDNDGGVTLRISAAQENGYPTNTYNLTLQEVGRDYNTGNITGCTYSCIINNGDVYSYGVSVNLVQGKNYGQATCYFHSIYVSPK